MTSPKLSWLPAIAAISLVIAAPALAMSERPKDEPYGHDAKPASTIADMEEAAGHILVLGPKITFETTKGKFTVVTFPKEAVPAAIGEGDGDVPPQA